MAIETPETRQDISDRIKSDVQSQLSQSNPYLRNSFLQSLIFGLAGRFFDIYKTIQQVLKQMFWDTSTGSFLERQAAWFSITRNAAVGSSGNYTSTGTATTSIPIGTTVQNSSGLEYTTQATVAIAAVVVSVTSITRSGTTALGITAANHEMAPNQQVTIAGANETEYNGLITIVSVPGANQFTYTVSGAPATPATGTITANYDGVSVEVQSSDVGQDVNLDAGDSLVLTSPIAGVDDTGYVQFGGIQGGADQETDDELRDRFLERVQNPVALFNDAAITVQAKLVSGVTRVFVFGIDETAKGSTATGVTSANQVAIFTATAVHNLIGGQKITVTGANEAAYNVVSEKIIVLDTTRFAYAIAGTPATPATGTVIGSASTVEEGQVKIYFTRDNDTSIIPTGSEITDVKTSILLIKPAHVSDDDVITLAPTAVTTNFTFTSVTPNTPTMQTAIEANLDAFFRERNNVAEDLTEPVYQGVIQNTVDPETNEQVSAFVLSTPTGTVSIDEGEIATLGTVAF